MPGPHCIVLDLARVDDTDKAHAFSWRAQDYVRSLPDGQRRVGTLRWKGAVRDDLAAIAAVPPDPDAIARIGSALADFLREIGWDADEQAILRCVAAAQPVHLVLRFAAAELYALPWEVLAIGGGRRQLATLPRVDIRYQWPGTSAQPPPDRMSEGGPVLLAWSAAGGPVPAARVRDAITDGLDNGGQGSKQLTELADFTYDSLADALHQASEPVRILHLLGHGAPVASRADAVGLATSAGVLDGDTLQSLLQDYASTLRLVVLTACRSSHDASPDSHLGSLAQEIHNAGVASVVASRMPLSVPGAAVLSQQLYRSLYDVRAPVSLERAIFRTRRALRRGAYPTDATSVQVYGQGDGDFDTRPVVIRPYRGLRAFEPRHAAFFVGRDDECEEITTKLERLRERGQPVLLVVEGASGSGKSSLVMAGLIPKLARQGQAWVRMVPGNAPVEALRQARASLQERRTGDGPGLLLIDQFEEVFTHVSDPALRSAFSRELWLAVQAGTTIVATLRSDFKGRCSELPLTDSLRLDALFRMHDGDHVTFVASMTTAQLKAAVQVPAALVGLELDEGLPGILVKDLRNEPGGLPLLQDALDTLWLRRKGNRLSTTSYNEIEGVAGALRKRADAVIEALRAQDAMAQQVADAQPSTQGSKTKLRRALAWTWEKVPIIGLAPATEQAPVGMVELAWRMLIDLVEMREDSSPDTRRRRRRSELIALGDPALADTVLDLLVAGRLLVRSQDIEEDDGDALIEVAHEALIRHWPALRQQLRENQDVKRQLDRFRSWADSWRRGEYQTVSTSQLSALSAFSQEFGRHRLPPDVAALMQRGRTQQRRGLVKLAAVAGVFVAFSVVVLVLATTADKWSAAAHDQRLLIDAIEEPGDPTLRVRHLVGVADPHTTESWLRWSLDTLYHRLAVGELERPQAASADQLGITFVSTPAPASSTSSYGYQAGAQLPILDDQGALAWTVSWTADAGIQVHAERAASPLDGDPDDDLSITCGGVAIDLSTADLSTADLSTADLNTATSALEAGPALEEAHRNQDRNQSVVQECTSSVGAQLQLLSTLINEDRSAVTTAAFTDGDLTAIEALKAKRTALLTAVADAEPRRICLGLDVKSEHFTDAMSRLTLTLATADLNPTMRSADEAFWDAAGVVVEAESDRLTTYIGNAGAAHEGAWWRYFVAGCAIDEIAIDGVDAYTDRTVTDDRKRRRVAGWAASTDKRQVVLTTLGGELHRFDRVAKAWHHAEPGDTVSDTLGDSDEPPEAWPVAVGWTQHGGMIAQRSTQGQVVVWNGQDGAPSTALSKIKGLFASDTTAPTSVACPFPSLPCLSPTGHQLVHALKAGHALQLISVRGDEVETLTGQGAAVKQLAWLPDGKHIMSVSADKLRVWRAEPPVPYGGAEATDTSQLDDCRRLVGQSVEQALPLGDELVCLLSQESAASDTGPWRVRVEAPMDPEAYQYSLGLDPPKIWQAQTTGALLTDSSQEDRLAVDKGWLVATDADGDEHRVQRAALEPGEDRHAKMLAVVLDDGELWAWDRDGDRIVSDRDASLTSLMSLEFVGRDGMLLILRRDETAAPGTKATIEEIWSAERLAPIARLKGASESLLSLRMAQEGDDRMAIGLTDGARRYAWPVDPCTALSRLRRSTTIEISDQDAADVEPTALDRWLGRAPCG